MANDYQDFPSATLIFERREADIAESVISTDQNPTTVFRDDSFEINFAPVILPEEPSIGIHPIDHGHATLERVEVSDAGIHPWFCARGYEG
ncbi:MAG TPA: hypothetical protein VHH11_18715 [Gammaproteobacteria bacterium]|nr:hypothetical protein [Gammaproteobacteria bacterium]